MDISIHDVTDITIGPIQSKGNAVWRKIKIKHRTGNHEIVSFLSPYARAEKSEDLEIILSDKPI